MYRNEKSWPDESIQKGKKISINELTEDGWKKISLFGGCEIWAKENKRLLWNPQTQMIHMSYENKD